MSPGLKDELRRAVEALPGGLRAHVLRVEQEALRLAEIHGADSERACIAALGHDLVRHKRGSELLALASQYGLTVDEVERRSPILTHGPIAARILSADFGLTDQSVLLGIDCHTTARAGMDDLEMVLFIADKIEPQKRSKRGELAAVAELAEADLGKAVLKFLDLQLGEAVDRGWLLHPRSLEARNHLLLATGR